MKSAWGVVFCVCVLALASGVAANDECLGDKPQPLNRIGHAGGPATANFYYSVTGTLLEADGKEGFLVLDLGSPGAVRFPLDAGFKMSADKRTRLHGIKELSLTDFQRGDPVHVKFSSWDGRIVRLKLKKPKR
jgi:hypothetical protein